MLIPKSLYLINFLSFKEQSYLFKNGKTVCVMGNNLTDEGQKSNGSGKSAFFTALEFIYTGNFSRKVSKTKLVFRGEKFAEVHHVAFNNIKNEYLQIERYLPAKGSEKVSVYLYKDIEEFKQNKDVYLVDIATTADTNKWIEAYVGVNKEDLMNYFLPNELTYKSFFDSSDTAKKELIGRFSNSEIVDPAFDKILKKEDEISKKIIEKERQLLIKETTLETRQNDLSKEQERDVEKENIEKIVKLKSEIGVIKAEINEFLSGVSKSTKTIKECQETANNISKRIKLKLKEVEDYNSTSKDFKLEFEKFEKNLIKSKEKIKKADSILNEINEDEKLINKDIKDVENNLAGEIECPKCKHKFVLSEDFTLEELKSKQKEYKKELGEVKEDRERTEKTLKLYQKSKLEIDKQINSIEDEECEFKKNLKKIKDGLEPLNNELENVNSKIKSEERFIKSTNESIKSKKEFVILKEGLIKEIQESKVDKTKEKELKKEIKELKVNITTLNEEISKLNIESENILEWNNNFVSFKSFLANKKLKVIEGMINKYLVDMKASYQLKLEGYKMVGKEIREKITPYIFQDGEFCEFGEFSHGERGRLNAASLCTFQSLINETSSTGGLNLLFPDEIFEGFDELGIELLLKSFSMVEKTILITTHVTNEKISDNIVMIEKENKISKIVN